MTSIVIIILIGFDSFLCYLAAKTFITILIGFDSFLCYLAAKTYGYICLAGSRKFVLIVIIWEQDSAFFFPRIFNDVQLLISP